MNYLPFKFFQIVINFFDLVLHFDRFQTVKRQTKAVSNVTQRRYSRISVYWRLLNNLVQAYSAKLFNSTHTRKMSFQKFLFVVLTISWRERKNSMSTHIEYRPCSALLWFAIPAKCDHVWGHDIALDFHWAQLTLESYTTVRFLVFCISLTKDKHWKGQLFLIFLRRFFPLLVSNDTLRFF